MNGNITYFRLIHNFVCDAVYILSIYPHNYNFNQIRFKGNVHLKKTTKVNINELRICHASPVYKMSKAADLFKTMHGRLYMVTL